MYKLINKSSRNISNGLDLGAIQKWHHRGKGYPKLVTESDIEGKGCSQKMISPHKQDKIVNFYNYSNKHVAKKRSALPEDINDIVLQTPSATTKNLNLNLFLWKPAGGWLSWSKSGNFKRLL